MSSKDVENMLARSTGETRLVMSVDQVPVEWLDYSFVRDAKAADAQNLECVVARLRTGVDGSYPDLLRAAEERLRQLMPHSSLLQADIATSASSSSPSPSPSPSSSSSSVPADSSPAGLVASLGAWSASISAEDRVHTQSARTGEVQLPPVRQATVAPASQAEPSSTPTTTTTSTATRIAVSDVSTSTTTTTSTPKRIAGSDFRAWDKYDPDKVIAEMEEAEQEQKKAKKKTMSKAPAAAMAVRDPVDRERLSLAEKDKGNELFRGGKYQEAVEAYSRSLEIHFTLVALNNRAQAHLKMSRPAAALADTTRVLESEPVNVKALVRHASALYALGRYSESRGICGTVLIHDKTNGIATRLLDQMGREGDVAGQTKEDGKGRRLDIVEVEEDEEEEASEGGSTNVSRLAIVEVDNDEEDDEEDGGNTEEELDRVRVNGNEHFQVGEWVLADALYTRVVEQATTANAVTLALSLLNRGLCRLNVSRVADAVVDYSRAIELVRSGPDQFEPSMLLRCYMRRAQAHERLAQLDSALSDVRDALKIVPSDSHARTTFARLNGLTLRNNLDTTTTTYHAPRTAVDLLNTYRAIGANKSAFGAYLRVWPIRTLPSLLTTLLDAPFVLAVVAAAATALAESTLPLEHCFQVLCAVAKTKRFAMTLMMLTRDNRKALDAHLVKVCGALDNSQASLLRELYS